MTERSVKFPFVPLLLLWLAVHAVLLAALLGAKFLLTKSAVMVMLLVAGAVFVFNRVRRGNTLTTP